MRFYLDNKPMRQVMTEQQLYDAKESSFWLMVEDGTTPTPTPTITQAAKTPVSTPTTPGFGFILGLLGAVLAYQLGRKW
jgi:hypothetical protein